MTETEKKALALVNEVTPYECVNTSDACHNHILKALYRAIEQHEAFRQEVSDAIQTCMLGPVAEERLSPFIIAKPDPLVEVIATALREGSPFDEDGSHDYTAEAKVIAAAIRASGLEVRKIGEGE